MTNILCALAWLAQLVGINCADSSAALVTVAQGQLQGTTLDLVTGDGSYYAFKGIPYAAAPVDDLRFMPPEAPASWEGVRNATEFGDVCYQYSDILSAVVNGSEDCLFLNVYTPNLAPTELLPVMVFVHGGDFKYGSGNSDFYGADLLVRKDVIVVTFNYRLEIFGFLSLENEAVSGNNGLKDQVAALQWIQENIAVFGGDAGNIILFGQSAGGVSTALHLLSTQSTGLFQKAIIQSGPPLTGWAITPEPRKRAFELGSMLGLNTTDDTELLTFLKSQPKENLNNIKANIMEWDTYSDTGKLEYFGPVVETTTDGFLTMEPWEYLENNQINDVVFMMGYTSDEGFISAPSFVTTFDQANAHVDYFAGSNVIYDSAVNATAIAQSLKDKFLGTASASMDTITQLTDFYTAIGYKYDTLKFVNTVVGLISSDIYVYEFAANTDRNYFSSLIASALGVEFTGACHSDDVPYLFDMPGLGLTVNTTADSFKVIEIMTSLWTNFAKEGNPTPDDSLGATWSPYTSSTQDYLLINTALTASTKPYSDLYSFMDGVYAGVYD